MSILYLLFSISLYFPMDAYSQDWNVFLLPSEDIIIDNPKISSLVNKLTSGAPSQREKAIRIHEYVRDSILFGFSNGFYKESSVEVLESKIGFCNTKSTLFVALLRAAKIPARQVFVDINAQILRGLLSPGTEYVDHSYTEVFLDGRWLKTDSYVVDTKLFKNSIKLLKEEGKLIGYGVHINGSNQWNGKSDSFSQFVNDGSYPSLTTRHYGTHEDTASFYRKEKNTWNKQSTIENLFYRFFIGSVNKNIARFRG